MKEIDFKRVSTLLDHLYCGPDKNSNTIKLWQKTFKGVLNAQEAKRLFEAFAGNAGYLSGRSTRMMVWSNTANPRNWTPTWCKTFFKDHSIQSVFGMTCGPDGKALHPRKKGTYHRKEEAIPTVEDPDPINLFPAGVLHLCEDKPIHALGEDVFGYEPPKETTRIDLSAFSDEELLAELQRRDDERKAAAELASKKALVEEFLAAYNLTMEDLLQITKI